MRFLLLTLTACMAAAVSAFADRGSGTLELRQAPGTPLYECHAECGGIIEMSQSQGYCEFSNFTSTLKECLDCALVYDIWQYYGSGVTSAAKGCGVDATPVPANSTASSTGSAQETTATATAAATAATSTGASASTITSNGSSGSGTAATQTSASTAEGTTATQSETSASDTGSASGTGSQTTSTSGTSSSATAKSSSGAASLVKNGPGLGMVPLGLVAAALL